MILQEVIKSIDSPVSDDNDDEIKWVGFFWCTLYVLFMLMSTVITMQINRTMGRVGAQIRGGFTAMIYSKGLRLTNAARVAVGEGKIVSLMEVDCAKLEWGTSLCWRALIHLLTNSLTCSISHSSNHSLTHSPTRSHTLLLAHSLTHPPTHSFTHIHSPPINSPTRSVDMHERISTYLTSCGCNHLTVDSCRCVLLGKFNRNDHSFHSKCLGHEQRNSALA